MSDINDWPSLIHRQGLDGWPDDAGYLMLPFNEYQMGNILGVLKRSEANGDWHGEIISIILLAMERMGIEALHSNFGDTFTAETIRDWSAFRVTEQDIIEHGADAGMV